MLPQYTHKVAAKGKETWHLKIAHHLPFANLVGSGIGIH